MVFVVVAVYMSERSYSPLATNYSKNLNLSTASILSKRDNSEDNYIVIRLWPSEIFYSHDSMSMKFTDGTPVASTFKDLLFGDMAVSQLPKMQVHKLGGCYYAISGNRRLRILKVRT